MNKKAYYIPLEKDIVEHKSQDLKLMDESCDNTKFPPIKEEKDPFLKWFWLIYLIDSIKVNIIIL